MMHRIVVFFTVFMMLLASCRDSNNQPRPSQGPAPSTDNSPKPGPGKQNGGKQNKEVPAYVLEVLEYVKANGEAPKGYVGGRDFQNRENRLDKKTPDGTKIKYREWDVNPKKRGQNRGVERLVTGSDNSAYYTRNHYKSFIKIE